ncbi:TIM-barrel domain-containing protein [Rugamonas sp.]|uniref:glycoside hydrolase family 31 protein n=1 Tax=Rugamonas sp. TaxID=1926287 RepID=UPI002600D239|nr:TIM-barrel domain-containing protein [Rugamonas sp.]
MNKTQLASLSFSLLAGASCAAHAQNAERIINSVAQRDGRLEVQTSDGIYLIKPYSSSIVETTFVPNGETADPASHAVVMAPAAVPVTLTEKSASIEYTTGGIAVTITRAPFQIAYSYKGRPLIAEQRGYTKGSDGFSVDFTLDPDEALYGAGARAVGMNRRGYRFQLYNKAHYGYSTHSELMNFTMPLALSSKMYAIHFDNPQIGYLDFDSKKTNRLAYETIGGRTTYQVIAGDTWQDVVGNYTTLTGRQPMPPRWAFGNFASRFGYHTEDEARKTVAKFIADDIPLDAIIFDLYWFGKEMKGTMGNLAFNREAFPTPQKMIADFKDKGVKTVLITEPFVLTTSSKWQDAVDHQILGTDAAGAPLTYPFYFGNTGLIDIFSQQGKDWFWNIYKGLHDQGVAGWWGDLGEPEVHPAAMRHASGGADAVHNIYGHDWARLIFDGYRRDYPQQRPFILMRAGYSGSQRFGMIPWSGDVDRSWGGLQSQPEIALQMGMQGMAYMHSDLGGFANAYLDDELYTRWLQYGVFQPVFRPHAQEEVPSEPVYRDAKTEALARQAIRLRYRMLPYNYALAFDNNQRGLPLMRPMLYEEPGEQNAMAMSLTYLWGDAFLVTPVMTAGALKQRVYFPKKGPWFDFYDDRKHGGGITEAVDVAADHIPVFVRAGAFIPLTQVVQSTRDYSTRNLELHYYHDASVRAASGKLYDDDGETMQAYEQGKYELLHFTGALDGRELALTLTSETGSRYARPPRSVALTVHNVHARPAAVTLDRAAVAFKWDRLRGLVTVRLPASAQASVTVRIKLADADARQSAP